MNLNPLFQIRILMLMAIGCLMSMNCLQAQNGHAVKVVARRIKPDSILLRWAPSDKETWKLGNQYGYGVIRYTLVANNVLLHNQLKELITSQPLRPLALTDWERIAKNNIYGAIAAQALYGADFKVDASVSSEASWQQAYQKSNEQDMRFSFALFAADMDRAVAKAAGLHWVDRTAKKNDRYLYKIYVALPDSFISKESSMKIDTAFAFVGSEASSYLPKPAEFRADFMDSTAVLSWNREVQQSEYVAYQIERSSDGGKSFQVRNKQPFVPILKDAKNPFAFYIDSTIALTEHQYRILGINAFGEKGAYTDVAKGMSKPSAQLAPQYLNYELQANKEIKLSWQYETVSLSKIQGFKVYRSVEHEKGYKLLNNSGLLSRNQLFFIDAKPIEAGYYQVAAVELSGKEQTSFPVFVQFEDTEAPSAPKGFKGTIDKQGQVKLVWAANTENDLLGYYVYASNGRHEEYARISPSCLKASTFATYIELKTLTDSVYYEVLALDRHYNESSRTRLALARPDIVPPAPVGIVSTEGSTNGINILWYNSPSNDAKKYLISRGEEGMEADESFATVLHFGDSTSYIDSTALEGKTYQYWIQTEDKTGLRSEKMQTLKVQRKKIQPKTKVYGFVGAWDEAQKKIKLSWQASGSTVKHWIIYRASQGERLAQYASAQGESFTDIEVESRKTYEYYLRPVFVDRTLGSLSTVLIVKLETK